MDNRFPFNQVRPQPVVKSDQTKPKEPDGVNIFLIYRHQIRPVVPVLAEVVSHFDRIKVEESVPSNSNGVDDNSDDSVYIQQHRSVDKEKHKFYNGKNPKQLLKSNHANRVRYHQCAGFYTNGRKCVRNGIIVNFNGYRSCAEHSAIVKHYSKK